VEFKRQAVERMKTAENVRALARELGVQQKLLYTWKYQLEGHPEPRHANLAITAEDRRDKQLRDEITRLKTALADKALEVDFLKSALLRVKEVPQTAKSGGPASTKSSSRGSSSKAR
jgi:predicted RNase H-like nuclease (RuvC/YqgF family)